MKTILLHSRLVDKRTVNELIFVMQSSTGASNFPGVLVTRNVKELEGRKKTFLGRYRHDYGVLVTRERSSIYIDEIKKFLKCVKCAIVIVLEGMSSMDKNVNIRITGASNHVVSPGVPDYIRQRMSEKEGSKLISIMSLKEFPLSEKQISEMKKVLNN